MKDLPKFQTLLETVRHLRPRQVRYQLARRLLPGGRPHPLAIRWRNTPPRMRREKNTTREFFHGGSYFRFNNEERIFTGDWNDPRARKLWLYNLHYMAWLFDLQDGREAWIGKWIKENPAGYGNGWEPYPVSLRLFNWCKHFSLAGREPDSDVLASMEKQASWLLARLEYHLDGNHLLENLLALAFVGFFLNNHDPRTARINLHIRSHLEAALSEQFLADGGHYELSPMYHAILLERMLDLLNFWPSLNDPFPGLKERFRILSLAGLDWLEVMSVDGRFALFNDSAYDAAPEAAQLLDYGRELLNYQPRTRPALRTLEASGYFRGEAGPFTLLFDAGKLGPDHQMGHAQGDMLSFCLWLREIPVIVHPGNFEYVPGHMRDYCRSTASHNTLVIEGCEQADWWSSHRVGWRGRPVGVSASQDSATGMVRIQGSHDGYSRLPGRPMHKREVELSESSLVIQDSLSGDPGKTSRVYFHFHPDCVVEQENGRITIRCAAGSLEFESNQPARLEDAWYCPEFGLRIRNRAVVVEARSTDFRSVFTFTAH